MVEISIKDIIVDDFIYARDQKDSKNTEVLVEKLKAGIKLTPIEVQRVSEYNGQPETIVLINGGHRLDAYEIFNNLIDEKIYPEVTFYKDEILDYETHKSELAIRSHNANDEQGLNSRMQDTRKIARNLKIANPLWTQKEIGQKLHRNQSTISDYIKDILQQEAATDKCIAFRLSRLGWAQREIAEVIGKTQQRVQQITNNMDFHIICNSYQEGKSVEEIASFNDLDIQTAWSIILENKSDDERAEKLGIEVKKYNVWNYSDAHELMGKSDFTGRIPGQIPFNIMYWFSKQGDLVLDPMAGSGTTLDAALLLNRKCRAFDLNPQRNDIEKADTTKEIPYNKSADLIFVNPPYWQAVDYGEGLSACDLDAFFEGINALAKNCFSHLKENGFFALMMGNQSTKITESQQPTLNLIDPVKQRILSAGFTWYMDIWCPWPTHGAQNWAQAKWDKGYLADLNRAIMVFRKIL